MKRGKEDRRVKYTKKVLRESLLEIMQERPINKISVTEICKRADINRNTFYTHYNSQFDLLSNIEDAFFEEIRYSIERSLKTGIFDGLIHEICQYIADNADICKILLSENGNENYLKRIIYLMHDQSINKWKNRSILLDSTLYEAMYSFISSGSAAIIHEWLKNGMKESPRDIAHFIEKAIEAIEQTFLN